MNSMSSLGLFRSNMAIPYLDGTRSDSPVGVSQIPLKIRRESFRIVAHRRKTNGYIYSVGCSDRLVGPRSIECRAEAEES